MGVLPVPLDETSNAFSSSQKYSTQSMFMRFACSQRATMRVGH